MRALQCLLVIKLEDVFLVATYFTGTEKSRRGGWENVFKLWNEHKSKWTRGCHLYRFKEVAPTHQLVLNRYSTHPIPLAEFLKEHFESLYPHEDV